MFVVSFLGGFLGVAETMVHTTLDKAISRIFPGQITVFEDCDLVNKSAFLTFTPFFKTLLAKTGHGVIYDFYFISQGWSHYFILLSATTLWKMTGYDLQLIATEVQVNFKDFSRPNKEINYFSRTLTEFKDFSRQLLKFKTFQDCTSMGSYCWFDSLSRSGMHRYCLVSFQYSFAGTYYVNWSWFVQSWKGLEFY